MDFTARIVAKLDTSEARKQLNNFTNDVAKIDIDIGKIDTSAIEKGFKSAGMDAGKYFTSALQQQINTMARTQRDAFSQPLKNMSKAQKNYSDWWNKELNKPVNANYGKNQQILAIDEYIKKVKAETKEFEKIQKQISQKTLEVGSSSIKKTLDRYSGTESKSYNNLKNSYEKLISLQKELTSGLSDDGLNRTLSNKEMISKFEQFHDVLKKCNNEVKILSNETSGIPKAFNSSDAITAGNKTLTWLKNNSKAASQIGIFAGIYNGIQSVIYDGSREVITAVKDVNAAQIDLIKVSDAPISQLKSYWGEAAESAKKYGATISDVINSTADWTRLGYSLNESKKLSEMTTLYQNVGDNMTQKSASESLVSTLQGFKLSADQAEHIVDVYNEVGNKFAIGSDGIGEALKRSASSMYAAGNTMEETVGLVTAANEVVQDPASIGTAYKTKFFRNCLYVQKCA